MTGPVPGTLLSVTVPATSANLGPGFDAVGLALGLHDEVVVEVLGEGADPVVEVAGEGAGEVPRDGSHLVLRALADGCAALGRPVPAVSLRCTNRIPHGRGLGSSAAATVAGLLAARALVAPEAADEVLLATASAMEGHPDNAAACLLGGLTLAWSSAQGPRAVRLDPHPDLRADVLVPAEVLSTETARGMLPDAVPHADAAHTAGRAALLVAALTTRPDLLLAATEDRLHQAYRAPAMPGSAALLESLRGAGHAATVSGAGPSVLVLGGPGAPPLPEPGRGWRHLAVGVATSGATTRTVSGGP